MILMDDILNILKIYLEYFKSCDMNIEEQQKHLSGAGATYLFEGKLCKYYDKKYALTFCNATTALLSLGFALGLKNKEILTSPINWGGSIAPFLLLGAKAHFIKYNPNTLLIDNKDLSSAITVNTKAVLSTDFNGLPVDSEQIKQFCTDNGLFYISDSSQSLGAFYNFKPAGSYADAIILSFSPGKTIFGGEGGAILTDNDEIYEKVLWYSQHPLRHMTRFGISNYNEYAPLNGRMNPLTAIFLNCTFESSIDKSKQYQQECYQLINELKNKEMIEDEKHYIYPDSSTYFNFVLNTKPNQCVIDFNTYLRVSKKKWQAADYKTKIIPLQKEFIKEYKNQFICSDQLMKQLSRRPLNRKIKIIVYNNESGS